MIIIYLACTMHVVIFPGVWEVSRFNIGIMIMHALTTMKTITSLLKGSEGEFSMKK